MDSSRELFVLRSCVYVSVTSVGNKAVDREMTVFVSQLPAPRGAQQIPQHCRYIVGRSLRIDPINGSRDSEQRDLGEILGDVERKAATEVREERRPQAFEQSLERLFIAALRCPDALR